MKNKIEAIHYLDLPLLGNLPHVVHFQNLRSLIEIQLEVDCGRTCVLE